jgi:hypothetical protein
MQGYSSTDRRGSLLNDWDIQEIGSSEASEVISSLVLLITVGIAPHYELWVGNHGLYG